MKFYNIYPSFLKRYVLSLFLVFGGVGLYSGAYAEEYTLYSNKNLQLCHDFLEMLNDKPVAYYARHYPFDPKFKEFSPLKMFPVSKEKFFPQIEENHYKTLNKRARSKEVDTERFKEYRERYFSDDMETYITKKFDANHDGVREQFFVQFSTYGDKNRYRFIFLEDDRLVYGDDGVFFSGNPFFYKGRFYTANVGKKYVILSDISLPYKKNVGFYKYDVCNFRVY